MGISRSAADLLDLAVPSLAERDAFIRLQATVMRHRFPGFREVTLRGRNPPLSDFERNVAALDGWDVCWEGELQPTAFSPVYTVWVGYTFPLRRLHGAGSVCAYVVSPPLRRRADSAEIPHRYLFGYLCLHDPEDLYWEEWKDLVATTAMPWIVEWLYFYEVWLETGVWCGPEKAHDGAKASDVRPGPRGRCPSSARARRLPRLVKTVPVTVNGEEFCTYFVEEKWTSNPDGSAGSCALTAGVSRALFPPRSWRRSRRP